MHVAATGTWICGELGQDVAPAMLGRAGWFPPRAQAFPAGQPAT